MRDGVRLYYEVHGDGPVTVLLLPPWSIVHSRSLEAPGPLPGAALPGGGLRPAWQRPVGPAVRPVGVRRRRAGRGRGRRAGRCRGRRRVSSWAVDWVAGCCSARGRPSRTGWRARSSSAPDVLTARRGRPDRRRRSSRSGSTTTAGGGSTPTTGGATCPGFAEFFFGEVFPEPHSTRAGRRRGRVGAGDRRRDRSWPRQFTGAAGPRTGRRRGRLRLDVRCPALVVHGRRRPDRPARRRRALAERARLPRSRWSSVAATASRRGTRSGSTCGCAASWRR